jgi:hypothetical protein
MSITSRQKARESENPKKVVQTSDILQKSAKNTPSKALTDLTNNSRMKRSTSKSTKAVELGNEEVVKTSAMTTRRAVKKTEPTCGLAVNFRTRSKTTGNQENKENKVVKRTTKSPLKKPSPAKKRTSARLKNNVDSANENSKELPVLPTKAETKEQTPVVKVTAKKSNPVKRKASLKLGPSKKKKLSVENTKKKTAVEPSEECPVPSDAEGELTETSTSTRTAKTLSPVKKKSLSRQPKAAAKKKAVKTKKTEAESLESSSQSTAIVTPKNKQQLTKTKKGSAKKPVPESKDVDESVTAALPRKSNVLAKKTPSKTPLKKADVADTEDLDKSVKTPKSSQLNASKSSGSKRKSATKSPGQNIKSPRPKKLPIWKQMQDQQKETNEDFDDVYDFVPDANEPKKLKKKRAPRKPKGESIYKPSRTVKIAKNQHDLRAPPPMKLEPVAVPVQVQVQPQPPRIPKTAPQPEMSPFREDPIEAEPMHEPAPEEHEPFVQELPEIMSSTQVEQRVAKNTELPVEGTLPSRANIPAGSILSDWDVEEQPMETSAPEPTEPAPTATYMFSPRPEISAKVTRRSTLALDNCFGFDTSLPENSVVSSSYVESTPLKPGLHQKPVKKPELTGVSPVQKVWRKPRVPLKDKPAPARLENVIQVVPRAANVSQKKPKDKQTTLLDFIQVTESSKDTQVLVEDEENNPPPTPPSAFCQVSLISFIISIKLHLNYEIW